MTGIGYILIRLVLQVVSGWEAAVADIRSNPRLTNVAGWAAVGGIVTAVVTILVLAVGFAVYAFTALTVAMMKYYL